MLPVLNKEYTLKIESQSTNGDGIAHLDGYTLFIAHAITGDTVKAKITKLNKSYGFAKLIEITEPSPDRAEPLCPAFFECGGCQLMNMSYDAQCAYKKQLVLDALKRIGGITCSITFNPAPEEYRYRNKMVFPFSPDGRWGFYSSKTHNVVQLEDCLLGDELNNRILNCVRDFYISEKLSFYNEESHTGLLRRVFTRVSKKSGEVMVVVSQNGKPLPHREKLVFALRSLSKRISSIILNINTKRTNLVLGDENITLFGKASIEDELLGLSYEISPHSFFQINHAQTEALYKKALEFAKITNYSFVYDLYCGIGTISLSAARYAKKVIGIEIVPDAIKNAKENAKRNNIQNAEFYCGAAEDIAPSLLEKGEAPEVIILDPPRKGSDEKTLNAIISSSPKRIVYVSCNPATLARDLKYLCENGYTLLDAEAFDLFPQTCHVETVVLLSKLKESKTVSIDLELDELEVTAPKI